MTREKLKNRIHEILVARISAVQNCNDDDPIEIVGIETTTNELFKLLDEAKSSLPPAEGAEAFIRAKIADFKLHECYPTFVPELAQVLNEFATLHAQRIADKMVGERLSGIGDAGKVAINLSKHLNEQEQAYFLAGFQTCIEYLKSRESHE